MTYKNMRLGMSKNKKICTKLPDFKNILRKLTEIKKICTKLPEIKNKYKNKMRLNCSEIKNIPSLSHCKMFV